MPHSWDFHPAGIWILNQKFNINSDSCKKKKGNDKLFCPVVMFQGVIYKLEAVLQH